MPQEVGLRVALRFPQKPNAICLTDRGGRRYVMSEVLSADVEVDEGRAVGAQCAGTKSGR